jgi:predicted transcriptional regulator YdeE
VARFRISEPIRVEREDTPVMFMRASSDTSEAIQKAWARFEAAVGLRGRKFFGAFDVSSREYRVCAQLKENDDPRGLGFEVATLPGGAYLCARLQGEPPAVYEQIPAVFSELVKRGASDASRPSIEFYRSRDAIDLLLPIA